MKHKTIITALSAFALLTTVTPSYAYFKSQQSQPTLIKTVPIAGVQMTADANGNLYAVTTKGIVAEFSPMAALLHAYPLKTSSVTVAPDGSTLYAIQPKGADVAIVNAATGAVENQIVDPGMTNPKLLALSPHGNTLYVLNQGNGVSSVEDMLLAFSTQTGNLVWSVDTGITARFTPNEAITVSADGQDVYIPSGGTMFGNSTLGSGYVDVNVPLQSVSDVKVSGAYEVTGVSRKDPSGLRWVTSKGMIGMYPAMTYLYDTGVGNVSAKIKAPTNESPVSVALGSTQVFVAYDNMADSNTARPINEIGTYSATGHSFQGVFKKRFPTIEQVMVTPDGTTQNLDVLTTKGLFIYHTNAPNVTGSVYGTN